MQSKHYLHGGDIDSAALAFGIDRMDVIDFSGNINPLGFSPLAQEAICSNTHLVSTYPDRHYRRLKEKIHTYCGASPDHVLVGNGTTELISLVLQTLRPKHALALGPTYSEYERELSLVGTSLTYHQLQASRQFQLDIHQLCLDLDGMDLLIICNPNNPTSSVIPTTEMATIIAYCEEHGIFVLVDETYMEFCEDISTLTSIPLVPLCPNLLVLRGISKFFASPGLRFGYGICSNTSILEHLRKAQNPWTVNVLAEIATQAMLEDTTYQAATTQLIHRERTRIIDFLSTLPNVSFTYPYANFILVKLPSSLTSSQVLAACMEEHMLIRDAASFPYLSGQYIRFCFLSPAHNTKLLTLLKHLVSLSKE